MNIIAIDPFMHDVLMMNHQRLMLFLCLWTEHRLNLLHKLQNRKIRITENSFSCFNLAHIQNVINDSQKMLCRNIYFINILDHLILIPCIMSDQGCNTHDRIHRCTDIMRHTIQEITFGLTCIVSDFKSLLSRPFSLREFCIYCFQSCIIFSFDFNCFALAFSKNCNDSFDHTTSSNNCKQDNKPYDQLHKPYRIGRYIFCRNEKDQVPCRMIHFL